MLIEVVYDDKQGAYNESYISLCLVDAVLLSYECQPFDSGKVLQEGMEEYGE